MKKIIKQLLSINKKYNLYIYASHISFNLLLSISSLTIIIVFYMIMSNKFFEESVINELLNVVSKLFVTVFNEQKIILKTNPNTYVLIIVSIIYISSVIYYLTKFSDIVFENTITKSYIRKKIQTIQVFIIILLSVIFELVIIFFSKKILNIITIIEVNKLFIYLFEIIIIFTALSILYLYLIPKNIKFKEIRQIPIITSIIIYLILFIFKIIITTLLKINLINTISFAFLAICYLIFIITYIILFGIIWIKNNLNK